MRRPFAPVAVLLIVLGATGLVGWFSPPASGQVASVPLSRIFAAIAATTSTTSPIYVFAPSRGYMRANANGVLQIDGNSGGDFNRLQFGGTSSSFTALKSDGVGMTVRLADDSANAPVTASSVTASTGYNTTTLLIAAAAPTISSGFGSSPSVVANNGAAAFTVNVGTGGVATTGVIGLPTATTGWNCFVIDRTTNVVTRETATSTTTASLTAASAWAASDVLQVSCFAY